MHIEAFIIHLDRAVERKANVETLQVELARLTGLKVNVLSAVDGKALSKAEIDAVYQRRLYKPYYPFDLSSGEVACFLSHRKCWQEIVDRGLDAALIVEDDVKLFSNFRQAFQLSTDVDFENRSMYLRFPNKDTRDTGHVIGLKDGMRLTIPRSPGLGTVGQLVSRMAADKLLSATQKFDRPVDVCIQLPKLHGVDILAVSPPSMQDSSAGMGASLIQSKSTNVLLKLRREILRALYRFKVRAINIDRKRTI